jgi:hypothetical protein
MSLKVAEQGERSDRGRVLRRSAVLTSKGQRRTEKRGYEWGERGGVPWEGCTVPSGHEDANQIERFLPLQMAAGVTSGVIRGGNGTLAQQMIGNRLRNRTTKKDDGSGIGEEPGAVSIAQAISHWGRKV